MKTFTTLVLAVIFLFSCGSKKEMTTQKTTENSIEINKEIKPVAESTSKITVSTGTKIGKTKPISEMELKPSMAETDTLVEVNPQLQIPVVKTEVFNHSSLHMLLQTHVSKNGNVNYAGFKKQSNSLRKYIALLGTNMPTESWSKNDRLAYWMNAYNAMTVDLILRNMPLKSIKDIKQPWDQRLWKLGDKWYNLDEIEHQILRKMDDPRIHFGINCASFSCPPLLNEAFTAANVNEQLEKLSLAFINDSKRNMITSDAIEISKIFNWFSKDFKQNGTLIEFLNTYSKVKINEKARVRYKDYDWSLNN